MNKQIMVAAAIALMVSGSAFAKNGGESNNTKCNGVGNKNSPCQPTPTPTPTPTSTSGNGNGYGYGGNATGGNAYSAGGNANVWGSGNSSISGVVLSGGAGGQGGNGGAGGAGGQGGTANATGVSVGGIGNKVLSPSATIEKGAVSNTYNPTNTNTYNPTNTNNVDNRNTNTNLNTLSNRQDQNQQQKQQQGQVQGQQITGSGNSNQSQSIHDSGNSSSSSSSSTTANGNGVNNGNGNGNNNGNIAAGAVQNSQSAVGSGNATTVSYNQEVGASSAFAPALTSGEDTCMGSSSVGGSGVGFGFSVGSTWTDTNCQRLKNARQMYNFGQTTIAIKMMCADAEVKKAAEAAGSTICNTPAKSASKSSDVVYSLAATPAADQGSICDRTDDEFIRVRNNCN